MRAVGVVWAEGFGHALELVGTFMSSEWRQYRPVRGGGVGGEAVGRAGRAGGGGKHRVKSDDGVPQLNSCFRCIMIRRLSPFVRSRRRS